MRVPRRAWASLVLYACCFGETSELHAQDTDVPLADAGAVAADAGVAARPDQEPEPAKTPEPSTPELTEVAPGAASPQRKPEPAPASASAARQSPPLAPAHDETPSFHAIAVAPTPGAVIALDKVPRNAQRIDGATLAELHALSLHDALAARLPAVSINDVQGNPLQPDVQYRGFTASPLLGTPQGLAVYQNGVRINEPFGDLLQWDLVPVFALADVQILPGANPLYGLNALGGSLVLRMKDGFHAEGFRSEALAGSFARHRLSVEYGHAVGEWAAYVGAAGFGEEGYRTASRSRASQLYADVRHKNGQREIGLGVTLAHTSLNGNGPAPVELLAEDRAAVYTYPDNTQNDLVMVALDANQRLSRNLALQGTAYFRHAQRGTFNGDEAELGLCSAGAGMPQVVCDEDGKTLRSTQQLPIESDRAFDAVYNRTHTVSDGYGGTLQLRVDQPLAARPNQLVFGTSYDGAHVGFAQGAELGRLTAERGVEGSGLTLGDPEFRTELAVENRALGAFVADTFTPVAPLAVTLAARLNWVNVELDDQLGTALTGNHFFTRVNPALGVTYTPLAELTAFAGYGESNRAPSAAELGCADPRQPCRVPNAFIADPPLEQVVSRSLELGLRTHVGPRARPVLEGSLAGFGARNQHDILFVAGSRVGTGYFQNAGTTQRIGLELTLRGQVAMLEWYAGYALLRATFESALELPGGANPGARDAGDDTRVIDVQKGDRIPGLPTHSVKAGVTLAPFERLRLGISGLAYSGQPYRGDEANFVRDLPGYVIFNAQASYKLFEELTLFVKAQNLLNHHYGTFGVLADPGDVLPGKENPRFVTPGAPLAVFGGVVLHTP